MAVDKTPQIEAQKDTPTRIGELLEVDAISDKVPSVSENDLARIQEELEQEAGDDMGLGKAPTNEEILEKAGTELTFTLVGDGKAYDVIYKGAEVDGTYIMELTVGNESTGEKFTATAQKQIDGAGIEVQASRDDTVIASLVAGKKENVEAGTKELEVFLAKFMPHVVRQLKKEAAERDETVEFAEADEIDEMNDDV
jgi:hypothetical protein